MLIYEKNSLLEIKSVKQVNFTNIATKPAVKLQPHSWECKQIPDVFNKPQTHTPLQLHITCQVFCKQCLPVRFFLYNLRICAVLKALTV